MIRERLKFNLTPWGAGRIAAWAIVFLFAASLVIPPDRDFPPAFPNVPAVDTAAKLRRTPVDAMLLPQGEPRVFNENSVPPPKGAFKIAWLGDSSLIVLNRGETIESFSYRSFIPLDVANALNTSNGRKTHVLMYQQYSARVFDEYLEVLHALEQKPDLIIVGIDPAWSFNSRSVYSRRELPGASIKFASHWPEIWGPLLVLGTPSQWAWGAAASFFDSIAFRSSYKAQLDRIFAKLDFIKKAPATVVYQNPKSSRFTIAPGYTDLFNFISAYKGISYEGLREPSSMLLQTRGLTYADTTPGNMAEDALRGIFTAINASRIPAIVYMIPLSSRLDQAPILKERVAELGIYLQNLASLYGGPRLKLIAAPPSDTIQGLEWFDMVHMTKADGVSKFFVEQIRPEIER